jgi:thiosulfate/3-mercaptopyruvate sulfurtransferase
LDLLISSQDLYRIIQNESRVIVVDTRSFSEFKNGHILAAVNVDLFQLHWFDTTKRGIKDFNRQTRLLLSHIGIRKESYVVFYDNVSGISAARGVWLLLYFSHKKVSMLDGGFEKWKGEHYPVETKSNPLIHSRFRGKIDQSIIAEAEEVNRSIYKKNAVIVDARSIEEYDGSEVRGARRGHIPSAINIDWRENVENGTFKSKDKLSSIYSKIPANRKIKIITYCQGGYRAAHALLALKMLGYDNVKMYLGSWGEWSNRLDLPTEQ